MSGRAIRLKTPLLFAIWFLFLVVFSGVWGFVLANSAIDYSLHDTYYLLADFHYVLSLVGASLVFAAIYFGLERVVRLPYREVLGQTHFWLFLVGSTLVFLPGRVLPLTGMPQRYVDYPRTFAFWSFVSSVGYAMTLASLCVFVITIIDALKTRFIAKKADGL